ncbi:MAG: bifunctional DNA-formamidopyrimidine glycosylase/DNA-(apurinic or apyrimidinic site) lyase [Verrucomicrobiales bacterium]|nr:bifunctional DNA-formamidopyrimidine glycosylase/DNA-(apurinic or apyrimidinic site) lyase [Verrucomicrobiales bacterium]MCP5557356.1 bifunctional DNA-formamidopyrimidine glycosylase/DNA-(apurinic or apyrimidinic site) lyase [Verrucomicrobiaceae bacterium]
MPELPEVETTLRGVCPHLIGKTVKEVIVREARLRWPVPVELEELVGCKVLEGARRGKYLLFTTAKGTLMVHLGMSGSLRLVDPQTDWKKHDHVAFTLSSRMQLRFHDPRRFGTIQWIAGDSSLHPLLAALGPEPLTDAFGGAVLFEGSRGKSVAVKQFIMDSHVVVGVGNIYACESLFMAGIHPAKPAGKVSRARYERLAEAIKSVLGASIEMGGTTLRDFLHQDGQPGYFKQTLNVYDREGQPCRVCGTVVKRVVQGQRSTFFCPKCQR